MQTDGSFYTNNPFLVYAEIYKFYSKIFLIVYFVPLLERLSII